MIEQVLAEDDLGDLRRDDAAPSGSSSPAGKSLTGPSEVVARITTRALRAVTFRVGHSPAAQEYDDEVRKMENHRRRGKLPPLGFPTSDSIIIRFSSWKAAFETCDLEPPVPFRQQPGALLIEVIDVCTDFWGVLPGRRAARAFAISCDVALQFRPDGWNSLLDEVREARTARGVETPEQVVRSESDWPPMPTAEQASEIRARLGEPLRHRRPPATVEHCHAGLRIYRSEHLGPDDQPTTTHYMAACRKDKRLVWPSTLTKTTGKTFTKLMAEEGM